MSDAAATAVTDDASASGVDSRPLTPIPPPRPSSPLDDISAGLAGDVIAGPLRLSQSTQAEKDTKQMKYAAAMANQWATLLLSKQRQAAEQAGEGQLTPQQTAYLLDRLVPILVEALSELLRVCEVEARAAYVHKKAVRKNPALKPRQPIRPLEWLAAYLVRHNPMHTAATAGAAADASTGTTENQEANALTAIYQKNIKQIIQRCKEGGDAPAEADAD